MRTNPEVNNDITKINEKFLIPVELISIDIDTSFNSPVKSCSMTFSDGLINKVDISFYLLYSQKFTNFVNYHILDRQISYIEYQLYSDTKVLKSFEIRYEGSTEPSIFG